MVQENLFLSRSTHKIAMKDFPKYNQRKFNG